MRAMLDGFTGWVQMRDTHHQSLRSIDMAITVVGTLLIITTWAVVR